MHRLDHVGRGSNIGKGVDAAALLEVTVVRFRVILAPKEPYNIE